MQKSTISSMKDFQVLNKLGQGAFGVVYRVKRKEDGEEYALKKVKIGAMKEKERENAVNEIRILASLNDEYIIGYKDCFYDESTSTLCVVMEFAGGGDLLKKVSNHTKMRTRFPEEEIWKALIHMSKGLKSLHDSKILHRDLKCANVFVTVDGKYKLGDLNVSKVLKKDMANTQIGTPYYASPEVWQDLPYDMKSDIWSLGCVVYEMTALRPPFQASDLQGLYKKVKAGVFERIPSMYSNQLSAIVGMMLKVNPKLRPSVDDILSNSIVAKNYKQGLLTPAEMEEKNQLLQTIKFNPFNLRALKDKLPRANYEKEEPPKLNIVPESPKDSQKVEPKDQIRQSRDSIKPDRERLKSAGNMRQPAYCESPKVVAPNKNEPRNDSKNKADNKQLPPKNPVQPNNRLQPPKPPSHPPNVASSRNNSKDNIHKSSEGQYQPPSRNSSRDNIPKSADKPTGKDKHQAPESAYEKYLKVDNSKPNLSKANPPKANPIQRPSSAHRVQPSWWG